MSRQSEIGTYRTRTRWGNDNDSDTNHGGGIRKRPSRSPQHHNLRKRILYNEW